MYIGVTNDFEARKKAHKKRPPKRMRNDVVAFRPFDENFVFKILHKTNIRAVALALEKREIILRKATSREGYNNLRGHPPNCTKFYFLKYHNKI